LGAVPPAPGRRANDRTALVDAVEPPPITGSHRVGDKRTAIRIPNPRRRIVFVVSLIAVFLAAALITALALR
jgi:hypothetical protein